MIINHPASGQSRRRAVLFFRSQVLFCRLDRICDEQPQRQSRADSASVRQVLICRLDRICYEQPQRQSCADSASVRQVLFCRLDRNCDEQRQHINATCVRQCVIALRRATATTCAAFASASSIAWRRVTTTTTSAITRGQPP